ncbi:MAG: M1 family metallopeptidase [Gemmatimonadota bacterium]|nr:M1 family metallopeptidase [Gemmatimonadota bacterium]
MQRPFGTLAVLLLSVTASCASGARPGALAPEAGDTATRHLLRPVPESEAFEAAQARGTRSESGAPGPRYWQQEVSYNITAVLDPRSAILRGNERIIYRNRSPAAISSIVLNLYQNIFSAGVPRNRFAPITGGVTLERVAAQGRTLSALEPREICTPGAAATCIMREPRSDAPLGYAVQGTLGRIVLPRPIASGDSAVLEIAWRHRVPPAPTFRTAYEDALGGRALLVAQWYPQVATFDDLRGWDATPYLGDGEFYLEYGDFDVALTLPAGWLVGATGVLQNPEEVLTREVLGRLESALERDSVTHVVTEADLAAGTATVAGGNLTWRFRAERVRDFAFATSDRYLWDVAAAEIPGEGMTSARIPVHALYRAGAEEWEEAARYGEHATRLFSQELVPYPYPQITIAEGPISGMEYPQIVFIHRASSARALYGVIAHEIAHEWFPMLVGSDEAAHAWMDEGTATYYEAMGLADQFPEGENPFLADMAAYLSVAGSDQEVPLMRHTDLVTPYGARTLAAYTKPGVLLRTLRGILGDTVYQEAIRTYAREWSYRHPTPWDFFNTVERVSGTELDTFFYPWWFETGTLDYAVSDVDASEPGTVRVTIRDLGEIPGAVPVEVTANNGAMTRAVLPIELWSEDRLRSTTLTVPLAGTPVRVVIDPEFLFPDVNRENNVWTAPGTR